MATTERVKRDAVLAAAVDLARAVAEETSVHGDVGEHLGYRDEGERLGCHVFAATAPGYRGWHWSVVLARPPRSRTATVCEVALLPGDDALLALAWVPWAERLAPADVGPTDVLPDGVSDDRLVPGYVPGQDDPASVATDPDALIELGAWRDLVPSRETLDAAATRWEDRIPARGRAFASDPTAFVVPLSGSLGRVYGVCVNEFSPDDGKVVRLDQTDVPPVPDRGSSGSLWAHGDPVLDELDLEAFTAE